MKQRTRRPVDSAAKRKPSDVKPDVSRPVLTRPALKEGKTVEDDIAHLMIEGLATNTLAAIDYSGLLGDKLDLSACFAGVLANAKAIMAGDLSSAQAMLGGQVVALNAMFTECIRFARLNIERAEIFDRFLRSGLAAQRQCRATAETLTFMQNPTGAVFARQANISHGPQQVNNGVSSTLARAERIKTAPIELLETNEQRMDSGAARAASAGHSAMAAVDPVNRPAKCRRKGASGSERL